MKIGVVYGAVSSNLGDLSINQGVAGMLYRLAPDAEVHVVLRDPTKAYLGIAEAAFKEIKQLTFSILRTHNIQITGAARDYAKLARAAEYVLEPARFIEDAGLSGCDVVLGNSGELLFAYKNNDNYIELVWNTLPALAAKAAGTRFITLPSTFGPFEASSLAPMLRAFFSLDDAVAARDSHSATLLAEFLNGPPPPILLDPAFFISAPQSLIHDNEAILGLVMRLENFGLRVGRKESDSALDRYKNGGFGDSSSFRFSFAVARQFLDQIGGKVHLIIASRHADYDLTHAIAQALTEQGYGDRLRVVQPASVSEYQEELAKVSFIIASRFHGCILGLLSGRPVLGVYFEQHGHKIPGLFNMLEVSDYCQNLSRTSPESLAESIVPLFLKREQAFAEMPGRLYAMQEETLKWLKQALKSKRVTRREEITAASLAYISGIEAVRLRTVPDVAQQAAHFKAELDNVKKETTRLRAQLAKEKRTVQAVRSSISYQLGNMLIQAIHKPGRNTILLPYRVLRLGIRAVGEKSEPLMPRTAGRKAYVLGAVKKRIYTIKQKAEGTSTHAALMIPDNYAPNKNSIFYLLHNSLPYATGGYAIRTHGLLRALTADGWHMYGVTRLGFPFDVKGKRGLNVPQVSADEIIPDMDVIDNVRYCRILKDQQNLATLLTDMYLQKYLENVFPLCIKYKPALIHGASNFLNGIVATNVARMLALPSIYEVRGLWELMPVSKDPNYKNTKAYHNYVRREMDACNQATAIIAITRGVKELLIERGVSADKIVVVPNGVDTDRFVPIPRDAELEAQLGYGGKTVVGYIGAFRPHESLDYLLQAADILRSRGHNDFRVLLVGDGEKYDELQTMCDSLRLRDVVTITGRVSHEKVVDFYSLIDIICLPRKGFYASELISPLKPFEAMSMGKAVVVSDVAAMAEIVIDGKTGLIHKKDDIKHLAHTLETLLDNPELTQRLGEAARKWVVANRDWRTLAKKVGDLYRELIKGKKVK